MTVMLPEHKISGLLRDYFTGMSQTDIASKYGVDQSTVSNYTRRLRQRAKDIGTLAAGEELDVMDEIESLRNLSVELKRSRITTEGARQGLRILKQFRQLGVGPDEHENLILLCRRVKDQSFIDAALRLQELEKTSGRNYEVLVSHCEELTPKVQSLEQKRNRLTREIGQLSSSEDAAKRRIDQLKERESNEKARIQAALDQKEKEYAVSAREIDEVGVLKRHLASVGLDIPTIVNLGSEFTNANGSVDLAKIKVAVQKYGSLVEALDKKEIQKENLRSDLSMLRGFNLDAGNKKKRLTEQLADIEGDIVQKKETLAALETNMERNARQYTLVETFIAMAQTSPSADTGDFSKMISLLHAITQLGWFTHKTADELRNLFVRAVMGDYLRCFKCDSCGAKFIVNREPQYKSSYQCPVCHLQYAVKADDTLLTEMISPSDPTEVTRAHKLQEELDRLKPLEVFLDIPCAICGKPMPNNSWDRKSIIRMFTEIPQAHPNCWNTFQGQAMQFKIFGKALLQTFEDNTIPEKPPRTIDNNKKRGV
jgi:transcriptional regulator with XRE-family HTH domain